LVFGGELRQEVAHGVNVRITVDVVIRVTGLSEDQPYLALMVSNIRSSRMLKLVAFAGGVAASWEGVAFCGAGAAFAFTGAACEDAVA
jgi:hypothetical protein